MIEEVIHQNVVARVKATWKNIQWSFSVKQEAYHGFRLISIKKKTKGRKRKDHSLKRRKPEETGSGYHPGLHVHCEGKQNELCLCWAVRTRGRGKQWAKLLVVLIYLIHGESVQPL